MDMRFKPHKFTSIHKLSFHITVGSSILVLCNQFASGWMQTSKDREKKMKSINYRKYTTETFQTAAKNHGNGTILKNSYAQT